MLATPAHREPTPLAIKISVVLQGWIGAAGVINTVVSLFHSTASDIVLNLVNAGFAAGGVVLLVGAWGLRRWAPLGLAVLALINLPIAIVTPGTTVRGVSLIFAFKWLLLVPLFVYWPRMTWREAPAPRDRDSDDSGE